MHLEKTQNPSALQIPKVCLIYAAQVGFAPVQKTLALMPGGGGGVDGEGDTREEEKEGEY